MKVLQTTIPYQYILSQVDTKLKSVDMCNNNDVAKCYIIRILISIILNNLARIELN